MRRWFGEVEGTAAKGIDESARSMTTTALEALLGIGSLHIISLQAAKAYYLIKNANGVKLVKKSKPCEFKS